MNGGEFLRATINKEIPKYIMFEGEERYWINQSISNIRKTLFTQEEDAFNFQEIEVDKVNPRDIVSILSSSPLFSAIKLIIIQGIERLKAETEGEFLKAIKAKQDGVYLILIAKQMDKRRKLYKELIKNFTVVDCRPLKTYEAKKWLIAEGKKEKLEISPDVADLLINLRGTSLEILKNETEKGLLYLGTENRVLTLDEWAILIGETTESNIFSLIDSMTGGDTPKALGFLRELLCMGEAEIKILFMLGKQIRQLFITWLYIQKGQGQTVITKELNCHPFVAEKLLTQANRLSYNQLRKAHRRVLEADYRVKTGQNEPTLELELLILDLTLLFKGVL